MLKILKYRFLCKPITLPRIVHKYFSESYDVIVIGGGHAGCEAAFGFPSFEKIKNNIFSLLTNRCQNIIIDPKNSNNWRNVMQCNFFLF